MLAAIVGEDAHRPHIWWRTKRHCGRQPDSVSVRSGFGPRVNGGAVWTGKLCRIGRGASPRSRASPCSPLVGRRQASGPGAGRVGWFSSSPGRWKPPATLLPTCPIPERQQGLFSRRTAKAPRTRACQRKRTKNLDETDVYQRFRTCRFRPILTLRQAI